MLLQAVSNIRAVPRSVRCSSIPCPYDATLARSAVGVGLLALTEQLSIYADLAPIRLKVDNPLLDRFPCGFVYGSVRWPAKAIYAAMPPGSLLPAFTGPTVGLAPIDSGRLLAPIGLREPSGHRLGSTG